MSTAHSGEPIANSKSTRGSSKKSSGSGNKSTTTFCTTEVSSKRRTDSQLSQDRAKDHSKRKTFIHLSQQEAEKETLKETTAYWNKQLQAQLLSRKKEEVDRFMALMTEWVDLKLEPFEGPCDGEGCAPSTSRGGGSSRGSSQKKGSGGGQGKKQLVGNKRQLERDDPDGNESEGNNDGGRQPKGSNKRSKSDSKKLWACPYLQYAPGVFSRERTCCGPGWQELHRLKEHINRSHRLPEHVCPRCYESFPEQTLLIKHQRAAVPCETKESLRNGRRDLADGFDKKQGELLKGSRKGPDHEKWTSWYCILFNEDLSSPHLPSPYQGDPADCDWRQGHTDRSKYAAFVADIRREALKEVRAEYEAEFDRQLREAQPTMRLNTLSRMSAIAASAQSAVLSGPAYSGALPSNGESPLFAVPPNLDLSQVLDTGNFLADFDDTKLGQGDAFDFNSLQNQEPSLGQNYQPYVDYSSSSFSDDTDGAGPSSNTSVEDNHDGTSKGRGGQQTSVIPQQLALPPSEPYAQHYYYTYSD